MINKVIENQNGKIIITEDVIKKVLLKNLSNISKRKCTNIQINSLNNDLEILIYLDGKFDESTIDEISIVQKQLSNIIDLELNFNPLAMNIIIG